MGKESVDTIGLTLGCIVFLADLIIFCIFAARVRISFDKQIIDEDWQSANDYWLKLSRVSGVMFSIFHIGTMSIVIAQCTNMHKDVLRNNAVAHLYWLLESLWTFNVNSAIVLITMRCYRVYKTTKTKFTPLKDWISNHQLAIEYFIWITYILIILFIITQYLIIISSAPNQYFSTQLSLINSLRMFGTAAILSLQLAIACFFFYIAHKSQQQTNWNEQSKAIIFKQTAKLAFIVIFLALIVGIIFYHAIWYLAHINTNRYALNAPYDDSRHRISCSFLEFLTFWLILYLTRLRSPPSDNDKTLASTTNTKPFLIRALSVKNRKEALRQQKLKELEERKKAFREREKRKQYTYHKPMRTADNTFNTLVIKTVARHEREKKFNTRLLSEIKQRKQQKRQRHSKLQQIHKELKERNINKPTHRYNHTDPAGFHDALRTYAAAEDNAQREVMSLDILEEEDDDVTHDFIDTNVHKAPSPIAIVHDESPLEPAPDSFPETKQQHMDTVLRMIDVESGEISDSPPIPQQNTGAMDALPKISVTPKLMTSASGYALTPGSDFKNKPVAVVLTPHQTSLDKVTDDEHRMNLQPTVSISDIETDTDDDMFLTDENDEEEDDALQSLPNINEDRSYRDKTNVDRGVTPFQSIIAKIGSVFTPRNEQKHAKAVSMFPNVRVVKETTEGTANDSHSGLKLQFNATPSSTKNTENKRLKPRSHTDPLSATQNNNGTVWFQANEQKRGDLAVVENHDSDMVNEEEEEEEEEKRRDKMQGIVDIYLDAFKKGETTNELKVETLNALPLTPNPNSLSSTPVTPQPASISTKVNKRSSGITHGIFHNVVHLKPMLLKRSHSDPDIRSRNEIWDQLLSAFKEMNDGPLPISPEPDLHHLKRPSFTNDSSHRDDSYYYSHRNVSMHKEDEHDREISNQTQLSLTERDHERGFHLFDFFNNNTNHQGKLDENIASQTKSKRKIKSDRKRKDKKKKKKKKERDSLKLPESPIPDTFQHKKSLDQPLTLRLPQNKEKDKSKSEKKQSIRQRKQSKSQRKQSKSQRKHSSNESDRKRASYSTHRRNVMTTADILKKSNQDPLKQTKSKKKKKKMHKLRMKQKQQTKQWMDNVHQVF